MTVNSFPRATKPGVDKWIGLDYAEYGQQWKEIFDTGEMEGAFVEQISVGGLGLLKIKEEGDAVKYDSMAQGLKTFFRPATYASGFMITEEAMEDNKYMELAEFRSREAGKAARETKEIVHANILNLAFSNTQLGSDGVSLASTAHLLAKGGTYSNMLATAADLSEASLEAAVIQIRSYVDDASKKISVKPLKLIVSSSDMFNAERLLKTTQRPDSAENDINALRSKGVLPMGYVVNDYLTDTDAWFIKTDVRWGLQSFQRRPLRILMDDPDFDTGNVKIKVDERYGLGWNDARSIFCSAGA